MTMVTRVTWVTREIIMTRVTGMTLVSRVSWVTRVI